MKRGEMLSTAILFATNKHQGQFDKSGVPYILHPISVMYMMGTQDEELQCIAILHDVVEDTKTSYQELKEIGMSDRVVDAVRCLTKVPGQTVDEYKSLVMSNRDAMLVKLSDLQHNTDIRRLKGIANKDVERNMKYYQFYMEIQQKLKEAYHE